MSRVKKFDLTYEALNGNNTFSEGDTVSGRVSLTLAKETKMKSLIVKLKGEARVLWNEKVGNQTITCSAHKTYFKVSEMLVAENENGTVLPAGVHDLKFTLKIPDEEMPSSFVGDNGKITYTLEAKMSRSWRIPSWDTKILSFVSKTYAQEEETMFPLTRSVEKEPGLFSKGIVRMSATVNKKIYSPGDTVSVVANIINTSSKSVKPKFSLEQIAVYRAGGFSTTTGKCLCKCVGKPTSQPDETVACELKIPNDIFYSIDNCDILSNMYFLKASLDISFATDPEVLITLLIVPAGFANFQEVAGPYPAATAGGPGLSDFPTPTFPIGPNPLPPGANGYGYPAAPYPVQPAVTNNQWAQQPPPYGVPAATFPSSSVPNQAPAAPLQLQQGEVPASHINPPVSDTVSSGSDHSI